MLDWMKTFMAVYRAQSVTEASRALHLTQPTVSSHLKALETHLGVALFDRLPRGMSPTAAGHELAEAAGSHVDLLEATLESSRRWAGARRIGTLRLGGPAELLSEVIVPELASKLDEGAGVRVQLGLADDLIAALRARELDLVVATTRVRARGIVYDRLHDEELVLVAGSRWAERIRPRAVREQGAGALAGAPLLAYAQHMPLLRRYWRVVFERRLTTAPRVVAADLRLLARATAAGAGVTVLPRYLIAAMLARRELVQIAHPSEPPRNTIHLAYRTGALDDPHIALVRELLRRASTSW